MALFENNWRLDNSIHWLLHRRRTMEIARRDLTHVLNIDISNESKEIKGLSRRFNCTMLDVERIVISYDGDLEKTANFLMLNQQQHMRYDILSPTECLHQSRTRDSIPSQFISLNVPTDINIQIQEESSRNARCTMQHPKSTTNLVNELSPTNGEWNPFKPSFFDTVRGN
ncbi:hypothetical protein ZOSMA_341G00020 [Zostera marina]|uniref:Uncharacterized protein n=1 Tax=Zostera marina TaxID=29655 RepID=A0A0K9P7F7_ZOSMR|nr:hypothetical protein ZOSMA_341G00020 [Zostera marina]